MKGVWKHIAAQTFISCLLYMYIEFKYSVTFKGILEWVAIPFSRGFSWPRDRTQIFYFTGSYYHHVPTILNTASDKVLLPEKVFCWPNFETTTMVVSKLPLSCNNVCVSFKLAQFNNLTVSKTLYSTWKLFWGLSVIQRVSYTHAVGYTCSFWKWAQNSVSCSELC